MPAGKAGAEVRREPPGGEVSIIRCEEILVGRTDINSSGRGGGIFQAKNMVKPGGNREDNAQ